ncbi:MAG TPA: exodeoxyribonuclease V subunit gamma [Nocardioidaceae bacterium]|nr:exodeoxyribonuclease V subunit gamma [Nocardioidaceae bacterium]
MAPLSTVPGGYLRAVSVAHVMLRRVTLRIHRAERTDLLADGLGDLLATPLEDPFAEEVVVVPARGVERWLTQRLSHRLGVGGRGGDGVCAGVRFLNPHSLVALLLGKERDDAWDPDRLVWPLLDVIDEAMGEPWCATLAAHLGFGVAGDEGAMRQSRRYSVARRLAGLFASYAVQRPQLITDWREGRDLDGAGNPLDEDLLWQAELWPRVVERVGETPPDVRHAQTVERLCDDGGAGLELPPRLSLFGHTRLPRTEVALLAALGELRDVHLWLPQASPQLWDDLTDLSASGPVPRSDDRSAELVHHPLLASLGRDARELQRTLAAAGVSTSSTGGAGSSDDTLLGWLQHDLRANHQPDADTRDGRKPTADDGSVQVHACHGATRQIDVLREVLVGLLADDPTLEPRDILVMCPDIETYAPLIQAGFGLADVAGEGHPAHRLRVRLADRALSSTNPLLAVAGTLVDLAGGRVTATDVLDLASAEPVRRRFAFTDDDLAQLALWVDQAGIRWGIDAGHRGSYGLDLRDNTWQAGLNRVLLGVTMAEDEHRFLESALPVDDVSSGDIDLAGRLAEYVARLDTFVRTTDAASTIDEWIHALSTAVGQLTAVAPAEAWQVAQFDRELARTEDAARRVSTGPGGSTGTPLVLADVRNLLAHRLGGRPTRANFRTGTLTVCTMVPMRSVPHRVVCLVGLDDGVFPRTSSVDGDDVLARDPLTGERDIRSEDRQLLLDAVMATDEALVITYTGANEHTGAERPPAVPLGELLDALDRTAAQPVRDTVLVRHPLQPFDVRNLIPGELTGPQPFSFDRAALAGAEAARGERVTVGPLVPGPLPARDAGDVTLADLQAFFAHPVRAFLRSRLDVSAPLEAEETSDAIPIDLDALEKWGLGDRLLADLLGGQDPADCARAERLRGLLPPGRLGVRTLQEVGSQVELLVEPARTLRQGTPRTIDVNVDLGDGRRLTGTVSSIFGNKIVTVTYSNLAAKHRLKSWIDLLALSAGHPDEHWTAHAVGKSRAGATRALAGPLDHRAHAWLRDLVDIYDRGMREPLPLPVKTACAYAEASADRRRGRDIDPVEKAAKSWQTDKFSPTGIPGEDADASHVRVFGESAALESLLAAPRADERWNDEPHRLGQYAWRLWEPLLGGAEKVGPL